MHEDSALKEHDPAVIGEFAKVTDGPHGYHVIDEASPIRMLTAKCAKDWFADAEEADRIAKHIDDENKRSSLAENDIILSTRGTVGLCALVPSEVLPANLDQDIARISWDDKINWAPGFVVAYLNSNFVQDHIKRNASGMVQQGLSLDKVRQIPIPRLSVNFQTCVAKTVSETLQCRRHAKQILTDSEQALLRALGIENWQPPEPLTYSRLASDVSDANRFDAEYYQPKYDLLLKEMNKNKTNYKLMPLGELSDPLKYGCSEELTYAEQGKIFLRIADLENKRFEMASILRVADDTLFRDSDIVQENDVLISRSGTLGVAVPITAEFADSAYGSYFIRTRPDTKLIHPEYLALFVNSFAGQLQVEGKNTGGVQTNLTIPAIESIMIPVGDMQWQIQFVKQVEAALAARKRAQALLDRAKRAVEIAIEDSESAALKFLDQPLETELSKK